MLCLKLAVGRATPLSALERLASGKKISRGLRKVGELQSLVREVSAMLHSRVPTESDLNTFTSRRVVSQVPSFLYLGRNNSWCLSRPRTLKHRWEGGHQDVREETFV